MHLGTRIFLLLLTTGVTYSFENLCPSVEDLQPCYCVSDGKFIRVDCMQVTSANEVRKAIQSTKGMQRVFIDFLRARIEKIPSDLFKGLHITTLSFTNCVLEQIGDEGRSALEGLEDTLEEFYVHFSFSDDSELKFLNLSRMNALEDLQIEGNNLPTLGNEWFRDGPVNVKNLFIMTNFIQELGDKAFASLKSLRNLWLTGNRFKTFKRSMLPSPALYLTSLDLINNEISHLPEDMFSHMPSLKEVILTENAVQRISESIWSGVWSQLTRVYLESNPLECDLHIEWIFKYPRPFVLKGKCIGPLERKDLDLKKIIDDNKIDDDYDDFF